LAQLQKGSMYLCLFILLGAGFRSRVRYINVLDPTNMCYYVSEILDAGRDGPLFMVIEVFVVA
jgi:hypothetical protein